MNAEHRRRPVPSTSGNRRGGGDRRLRPTPLVSRYTLRGRRLRIRRDTDMLRGRYVDRAGGSHLVMLLLLILFITIDAASTLFIIEHGGSEENPLMDATLRRGVGWFLLVKLGPLPLAFALFSVHRHFTWVRLGMMTLLGIYGALMVYHLVVLARIV